ncbi:putative bifunctional diguanylate cyclase/phosphodiesterase [uncultured Jatrophihabitans sp.]|uniref:putative bifunctional diguanylate cyclase/phosphodiesterase n=1 Tax=uncultured Jatrophihabitans sp. TaxID=1610747 RepID=UPI0035CC6C0F
MPFHWSTLQLTEFLVSVSRPPDLPAALRVGLERGIESLDAEVGTVVIGGEVAASIGFGARGVPPAFVAAARAETPSIVIDSMGELYLAGADLDKAGAAPGSGDRLVIGRLGEACSAEEVQMLHAYALVLGLVRHNLRTLHAERARHRLVNTLLSIQRAISARHPLQQLLDAVTEGASLLLNGVSVALLLADPAAPGALIPASSYGVDDLDPEMLEAVQYAMTESESTHAAPHRGLIASPVVVDGAATGCLVARVLGTPEDEREYGELLAAFAQQVSLALTDARTMDAVREAHRDAVTGLPNRKLLLQQLERERKAALTANEPLCVLFIDLDRFKAVNDTLGHQAGDDLLALVAERILACTRSGDLTARLGGDEFAVVLPDADVPDGRVIAGRIINALNDDFVVAGRTVSLGASVGVAALSSKHLEAANLLSDADVAMYCAKRAGRGGLAVFEGQMLDEVENELSLRTDLTHALPAGQLSLAYQPIIDLASGELRSAEALLRWVHPLRGAISPGQFIPIAEQTDLICTLGDWAMRTAAAQTTEWRSADPALSMAVNVAVRQVVDPVLPDRIREVLDCTGLPADALTLEITESSVLGDRDIAAQRLTALRDLGVHIAVDDFGTGYSSLSYLRHLPVDIVKIDRSFVSGLGPDAHEDIAVVESLLTLCHRLKMRTIAEGIENLTQLSVLQQMGCGLGQGYLFARPVPAAEWPEVARRIAAGTWSRVPAA